MRQATIPSAHRPTVAAVVAALITSTLATLYLVEPARRFNVFTLGLTKLFKLDPYYDMLRIASYLLPFCNETSYLVSLFFMKDDPLYDPDHAVSIHTALEDISWFTIVADLCSMLGVVLNVILEERDRKDVTHALLKGVALSIFSVTIPGMLIPTYVREVDAAMGYSSTMWTRLAAVAVFVYSLDLTSVVFTEAATRLTKRISREQTAAEHYVLLAHVLIFVMLWGFDPGVAVVVAVYMCMWHPDRLVLPWWKRLGHGAEDGTEDDAEDGDDGDDGAEDGDDAG